MSAKLLQAEITQENESNNYATDVLGKNGLSLKKRRKKKNLQFFKFAFCKYKTQRPFSRQITQKNLNAP